MTQRQSQSNMALKGLGGAILVIQVIDIAIHAATQQIETLRVASNLLILAWVAVVMLGKIREKFTVVASSTIGTYLALNVIFLLREGLTNPNQGGELRVMLFVLVGVTVVLSSVLTLFGREKRD